MKNSKKYGPSWADRFIEELAAGKTVQIRPAGHSMTGLINNGQLITVEPIAKDHHFYDEQILLVRVDKNVYVHRVLRCEKPFNGETWLKIGNNRGGVNGWAERKSVYGIVTKVED